jgi:hypothetical protein
MVMADKIALRKTISEKCGFDYEIIKHFNNNSLVFILGNSKKIEFEKEGELIKIIFKGAKLMRDYFKVVKEDSSSYNIWGGRLYININQFGNYINKKKLNTFF